MHRLASSPGSPVFLLSIIGTDKLNYNAINGGNKENLNVCTLEIILKINIQSAISHIVTCCVAHVSFRGSLGTRLIHTVWHIAHTSCSRLGLEGAQ